MNTFAYNLLRASIWFICLFCSVMTVVYSISGDYPLSFLYGFGSVMSIPWVLISDPIYDSID